jgi:hypothetical protein
MLDAPSEEIVPPVPMTAIRGRASGMMRFLKRAYLNRDCFASLAMTTKAAVIARSVATKQSRDDWQRL